MRNIWEGDLDDATQLWRYVKIERFYDLIKTNQIYFASARQFDDPYEGAISVVAFGEEHDRFDDRARIGHDAFEELRRLTKVSCWHMSESENDAMWQLYASKDKGVAICTDIGRLKAGLLPYRIKPEFGEEVPLCGEIRYVDLLREKLEINMQKRFFYKHNAFAWESEYRVMITLRSAEEYGVKVPRDGILVPIDCKQVISNIVIGPNVSALDRNEITAFINSEGMGERLVTTSLLGTPLYF